MAETEINIDDEMNDRPGQEYAEDTSEPSPLARYTILPLGGAGERVQQLQQ